MARPPNYNFERQERERLKAIKAAEKAAAKRERAQSGRGPDEPQSSNDEG